MNLVSILSADSFNQRPIRLAIFAGLSFLFVAASASAGRYELIKGKGVEVCEAYGKALDAAGQPMRCDRKIPAGFDDFKKPAWSEADVQKNRILIARILNYLETPRDYKATRPLHPVIPEERFESFKPIAGTRLLLAKLDIDNDGSPVWVAKYGSPVCDEWSDPQRAPRWVQPLLVVDPEKQTIDIERTARLMQNPGRVYVMNADTIDAVRSRIIAASGDPAKLQASAPVLKFGESPYAPGSARLQGYDVLIFRASAYFDRWGEDRNGGNYETLTVYEIKNGKSTEACRYQFHN